MPTKSIKTIKKAVKPAVVAKPVFTDIPEPSRYCHCTKRKRNTILTCVSITSFLLGFLTYHIFFCPSHPHIAQHVTFVNGCLDTKTASKKLLKNLPAIDIDHDGCITKQELRSAKKPATQPQPKPASVAEPAVVDAIAPVME